MIKALNKLGMRGIIKLSLFADELIVCVNIQKNCGRGGQLGLISDYSKVIGYEVNIQKLNTFLNTSSKKVEFEIKNKRQKNSEMSFTLTLQK